MEMVGQALSIGLWGFLIVVIAFLALFTFVKRG